MSSLLVDVEPIIDKIAIDDILTRMSAQEIREQLSGVFGKRYGEIFLASPSESGVEAVVYTTFPLNDCPPELWSALAPEAIAAEYGAAAALLDGPRCWLVNGIEQMRQDPPLTKVFGGIEMRQQATVTLPSSFLSSLHPQPYAVNTVTRNIVFTFDAGQEIYELIAPDGRRWAMQSWSQNMDINLSLDDLRTLDRRLTLPPGWTYQSGTLTSSLRLDTTTHDAPAIVDNLGNHYSLENN